MDELTLEKFEEASEIVKQVTLETKLVYSEYFSAQTGNRVYFKPENMQYTGAYKVRGAYYKISTLSRRRKVQEDLINCLCRKPCSGRGLCRASGRGKGNRSNAYHNAFDQG